MSRRPGGPRGQVLNRGRRAGFLHRHCACRLRAVQLAVLNLDPIADAQIVDALVVELRRATIVQADADAIDLVVALPASFDLVAGDGAANGADHCGRIATAAAADLAAEHAADDRAEDGAAA